MTTNQILSGLVVYQLAAARLKYRGLWWLLFLFLIAAGVFVYFVIFRLCIAWPSRLRREIGAHFSSHEVW
jgi:hypothetical protein